MSVWNRRRRQPIDTRSVVVQPTKMQEEKEATSADLEQPGGQSLLKCRVLFRVLVLYHHITTSIIISSFDESQTKTHELIALKKYLRRYMTVWNFTMQIIYLSLGLLCDFQEWTRRDKGTLARKLISFKQFFFSSLVFPSTWFVTTFFWSICCLDRELLLPKATDHVITPYINHSIHTFIVVVVLVDVLLQPGERPLNDLKNKITVFSITVLYQITIIGTYLEAGHWIYPMFSYFNVYQHFMFYLFTVFYSFVSYEVQWPLTRWARKLRSIKSQ